MTSPGFRALAESGELEGRIERARGILRSCVLCPRECRVDRIAGERGYCGAGVLSRIFRHMPHPGEEPPISGTRGSGVILFSHCTMACVYCQNWRWSQLHEGTDRTPAELAAMMGGLARAGCHNLNLVSATQYIPGVLEALLLAHRESLSLPVVWNTSGYESPVALELLDGVVDVYLADIRYASDAAALEFSDAPGYVGTNREALREMKRQVGGLVTDEEGIAARGLIVRHLVLPKEIAGTRDALWFVAGTLGRDTFVSLMAQYYPAWKAGEHRRTERRINYGEWQRALAALERSGLENGWVQEFPGDLPRFAGTEIEPDP